MPDEKPIYHHALYFTVQLGDVVLELKDLHAAQSLFDALRRTTSDTDRTLNLVAWAGRSSNNGSPEGGPPIGYILGQYTWG
jgi:hypothetical protein